MHFHIILTERCNSQCKYCYEKSMKEFDNGLEKKWNFDLSAPIDSEVKISELKRFLSQDKNPTLIFYGGEPLLEVGKIKEIMDKIKAKFCMQTNGKILDKLPSDYLNKMLKILISIDGDKERTNFNKGAGTYELVLKNLKSIRARGFNGEIVGRMTIAQNFPDIFEQVKHLTDLALNGHTLSGHENLQAGDSGKPKVFDSIHWQLDAGFYKFDFNSKEFSKFVCEYNKSISKLIDYWIKEMDKGRVLKLYPFIAIVDSILKNEKTKLRCGSGYANYTITTSGKLSACPIVNSIQEFYCGNLNSKIGEIKQIPVGESCVSCRYLDLCGGRCLYSNKAKLWPAEGEKLICKTIQHLIDELKRVLPSVKNLIARGVINEKDFEYEKYFGPEIIP